MFKVGDTVICKPGFDKGNHSGGAGYDKRKIFIIDKLTDNNTIAWAEYGELSGGVWVKALELHKEKEEQQTINNNYSIF